MTNNGMQEQVRQIQGDTVRFQESEICIRAEKMQYLSSVCNLGWSVLSLLRIQVTSQTTKERDERENEENESTGDSRMIREDTNFAKFVDNMVEFSQYDPELESGLKWLDEMALKRNISFYDMVFEVLYKHNTKEKAREWLHTRN